LPVARQCAATAAIAPIAQAMVAAQQDRHPPGLQLAGARLEHGAVPGDDFVEVAIAVHRRAGRVARTLHVADASRTSTPRAAIASTSPATRKASGPIEAPRREAPMSVGTPNTVTGG
jgi:hypothetical protein